MIKSTLLTIAAAACAATVCAQTPVTAPEAVSEVKVVAKAPAKAPETTNPVIIKATTATGDNLSHVFAYRVQDGETEVYAATRSNTGTYDLSVPKGTFNFMAFGRCESNKGIITLYKENIECALGTIVEFNTADADKRTDIQYCDASGSAIDIQAITGSMVYTMSMASVGDHGLLTVPGLSHGSVYTYFRTNNTNPDVEWHRADIVAGEGIGTLALNFKVDFTKEVSGPDTKGWYTAKFKFQPTPANAKMKEFVEMMRAEAPAGEDTSLTMPVNYGISFEGHRLASGMFAAFCMYPDGSDIAFWTDRSDHGLETIIEPTGEVFFSDGIMGMPVHVGPDGLETLGVNLFMNIETVATDTDNSYGTGNPFFNRPLDTDAVLGNCAPAFFAAPYGNYPHYTFFGRHGENMRIDSFDMNQIFDEPMVVEMLGGQTNTIVLKKNGELVTDDRSQFPSKITWDRAGEYSLEVTTKNILIDGTLPGQSTATQVWCAEKSGNSMPSISALTFRDANGKTTDRFAVNTDATLSLYCSDFKGILGEAGLYFECKPVETLKVEYAVAGSDVWTELTAVADPSLDFVPGYGNYYSCDLAEISTESTTGWYDLRLTVTNAVGGSQTQTIAPAVKIDTIAGVADITADTAASVVARYNLQGQRIDRANPGALVIERLSDGSSRKVVVK